MKTIVKELEKYRLENKISQQELAGHLDVAFCTVNRWFKNRNEPNQIQEYHIKKMLQKNRRKQDGTKRRSSN
jgi:transcriptional regulator with XRE-family HTH domain